MNSINCSYQVIKQKFNIPNKIFYSKTLLKIFGFFQFSNIFIIKKKYINNVDYCNFQFQDSSGQHEHGDPTFPRTSQ